MNECGAVRTNVGFAPGARRRDDVEALRADLREAEVDRALVRRVRGASDRSPASAWRDRRIGHDASTGRKPRLVSARATTGFVCGLARTSASTSTPSAARVPRRAWPARAPLLLGDLDAADVDRRLVDLAQNARRLGALLAIVPRISENRSWPSSLSRSSATS